MSAAQRATGRTILHVVASSRGGGAVHVRDLAAGLQRVGVISHVVMPEDGGNVGRETFAAAGVQFTPFDIARGFSVRAIRDLARLARTVDVLHVHGARAALFGRLTCATLAGHRPHVVYTIHGFAAPYYPPVRRTALLAVERVLMPFTDLVIAVCHAERQSFLETGLARSEQVCVIWNGIDVERFAAAQTNTQGQQAQRGVLGVPPGAYLVTSVCRLDRPRDFATLLKAFDHLANTRAEAHLLILGDGPQRPAIEAQVATLGLGARVTLTGWREADEMPLTYQASDLFVLTTYGWEGLPLTVLEAMASGLPVVATRAGGTPEAVLDGTTGLLVERGDVTGLAGALESLAADEPRRRALGTEGRIRARQHFTVERMVAETAMLYDIVCAATTNT